MKVLTDADFLTMPWKNGGGSTCELFRLSDPSSPEQFYFRLSRALVESSGPFSLFPGIDRTLILLEGNGFNLNQKSLHHIMSKVSFSGEEHIQCDLIDGPCSDFNVMVKREWGRANVEVIQLQSNDVVKASFIYLPTEHKLIRLEPSEVWTANSDSQAIVIKLFNFAN